MGPVGLPAGGMATPINQVDGMMQPGAPIVVSAIDGGNRLVHALADRHLSDV